uniref:Uncharacterized protein n=1 Tax=Glossina palpalis gambiensis TaxID=67801 RepID=A0A1B0C084_9MUSC
MGNFGAGTEEQPPPISLNQPANFSMEEWDNIPLDTIQILYKSVPRRTAFAVSGSETQYCKVLDARHSMGTIFKYFEEFLRKEKPHKHIFVLDNVDLAPARGTQRWVAILNTENPTIASHTSKFPIGRKQLVLISLVKLWECYIIRKARHYYSR